MLVDASNDKDWRYFNVNAEPPDIIASTEEGAMKTLTLASVDFWEILWTTFRLIS